MHSKQITGGIAWLFDSINANLSIDLFLYLLSPLTLVSCGHLFAAHHVGSTIQTTQKNKTKKRLEWPAQMKYVILALLMLLQMHSSLDKSAIYFLVVMTSLDATQTDDFIRRQSKLILQMIFLFEYCCFVFIWFSTKHLNIFPVMLQSLQDAFLLLNTGH